MDGFKQKRIMYAEETQHFKDAVRLSLVADEGKRNFPYVDTVGKITIGIGHNLTDNGIPDFLINLLFNYDVSSVWNELLDKLPWVEDCPENVKVVLLNMTFNMGVPKLLQFKKTLEFLKKRNWGEASREMLDSNWARELPNRASRLSNLVLSTYKYNTNSQ